MDRPVLAGLATLTLLASLAAGQPAPPATPGTGQSPWNTGTASPPQRPPAEDSTLSLRIYDEGLGRGKLPYSPGPPRRDDPAWAADVTAVMTRCSDGNLIITALVIGGQLTPLDNRCPDKRRQEPATTQCDAKTWNCATKPAQ